MRCYCVLYALVALLLFAGCGSTRKTWICKDVEFGAKPRTQQKYAIKSLSVSFSFNEEGVVNAVTAKHAEDYCQSMYIVSKEWVDYLYELHPNVFDRKGMPVDVTAEHTNLPAGTSCFERSGARKFWGSIGFLTLFPIIPVENINEWRWRVSVFDSAGNPSETSIDLVSEDLIACSPLGLFCSYDLNGKGHVQMVSGNATAHGSEILRKQMEAIGLSIAGELVKLESCGRIRIGQVEPDGQPSPAEAKADDVVRRLIDAKRKELEDLKKAGIIDEAEYAAEVKKLEGTGK